MTAITAPEKQGKPVKEAELAALESLRSSILKLNAALQESLPEYKTLLQIIHKNTREIPELAMVLSEDEIAVCVAGYIKLTGATIIAEKVAKKVKSKSRSITVEDLM